MMVNCQQPQTQIEALMKLIMDNLKQTKQDSKTVLAEKIDSFAIRLDAVDTRQIKSLCI